MKKVIEELEKNYELIIKTGNDEITRIMSFSEYVYQAFEALMQTINKAYVQNINPNKPIRVFIKQDKSGRVYLKVTGRDRNTKLIIRSSDSKFSDYFDIEGYKITEKQLSKTLDVIQREKLAKSKIPKRFLKEIIPEIDLYEEMGIETFLNICKKIERKNNAPDLIELYEEPENMGERKIRKSASIEQKERMHDVIPYELRNQELTKHNHKKIIRFKGSKTNKEFDAYIYIKNGYILAIIEPLSGVGYQYNLNLGLAEYYNTRLIVTMIKAVLEASEDTLLKDDAIIRKNHTTLENFKENIETFLNNKKDDKRFYEKVTASTKVYQRKK